MVVFIGLCLLLIFHLVVLSIIENEVMKFPIIIIDLFLPSVPSIFPSLFWALLTDACI